MAVPIQPTRVLIVDDDDDVRETLLAALTDQGFLPVAAANGLEALAHLRSAAPRPSIILLDMTMPVLDGHGFRAAQLADPEIYTIPVIVMTALADIQDLAVAVRATAFVRKPMSLRTVVDLVRRHAVAA